MKPRRGSHDVDCKDLTPLFSVVGLIVLDFTLPYFAPLLEHMIRNGLDATTMVVRTLRPG
jgi:flagellar biosynthetic protein FliR